MAEIINLRQARKARARAGAAEQAAANRALHGQTKAEKARVRDEQQRLSRVVDGARLDSGEPGEG